MQSRMKNPAMIYPEVVQASFSMKAAMEKSGLSENTAKLVLLRVSQINGCSVCVDMHARELRQAAESEDRLFAVAAWHDSPQFTNAERAALALAEAATRIADRSDPVPDAVWHEATRYYDERALAALVLTIGLINFWNRVNVTTGQVAGEWRKSPEAQKWVAEQMAVSR
jgi:AhpD family alkylhydroperoxidase